VNTLTLAVAGGRKTQSIVDYCRSAPDGRRVLVLTYTQNNQQELTGRLATHRPIQAQVDVRGWFSFLLNYLVRPYLPTLFPGRRLRGLQFQGDPGRVAGPQRFLTVDGLAYKLHLASLAYKVNAASESAALNRLSRIYDEIYIDEVQDLNGYDLEILSELFDASIDVSLVGDIRQALIQTNVQDPKNKQYKGIAIGKWFEEQERRGRLKIVHQHTTWRCNQEIADVADRIFPTSWGFPQTVSESQAVTGHDGVFAVDTAHVDQYVRQFSPLCLRHDTRCAKHLDHLEFINITVSKGLGVDRVLLAPTQNVLSYFRRGTPLDERPSCSLYVALTRARFSVAIVTDHPETLGLRVWGACPP
jgi:DNA helicase-2/ATP-dependent DNA helicase PcrA